MCHHMNSPSKAMHSAILGLVQSRLASLGSTGVVVLSAFASLLFLAAGPDAAYGAKSDGLACQLASRDVVMQAFPFGFRGMKRLSPPPTEWRYGSQESFCVVQVWKNGPY